MAKNNVLPLKYRQSMLRTMRGVFRIIVDGGKLEVRDMDPRDGIGCSYINKGTAYIFLATGYSFEEIKDPEKELVLYGIATHAVLHILRTDFDYASRKSAGYPVSERKARHMFANIVEDAAIEYLRSDQLSDFLNDALTASIGYFHKTAEPLGNQGSAYAELITALIMFGDVGTLKGHFTFKEAEDAFIKVVPLYESAIVETSFAKRYKISQDMFEICRPLWDDHVQQQIAAESMINDLLKALGKNMFSSNRAGSKPSEDKKGASSSSSSNSADQRRKKTVHLINKEQAKKMQQNATGSTASDPGEATDIYVVMDEDKKEEGNNNSSSPVPVPGEGDSSKESGKDQDFNIVDERPDASKDQKSSGNNQDESGNSSGQNGSNEEKSPSGENSSGSRSESSSENGESGSNSPSKESGSESNSDTSSKMDGSKDGSNPESGGNNGNSQNPSKENSGMEGSVDGSASASGSESPNSSSSQSSSSGNAEETLSKEAILKNLSKDGKNSGKNKGTSSLGEEGKGSLENVVNGTPDDSSLEKKDLGEELKELSKSLSEELKASGELDISADLSREMQEGMENDLANETAREHLETRKSKAEAIDVTVSSPYYTDVKYTNIEVLTPNKKEYNNICTDEIRRLTLNLRSAFKKVFRFKSGHKEYRTNGRIDIERFSGKKLSARMFYRNSKPDDKADMAIVVFIDQSGSMRSVVDRVKQTMVVLLDALRGFDVKVKVVGFTTNGSWVTYFHYGNRKWENDENLVKSVMNLNASEGTFLGHALRYTGTMLKNRPETNKLYICITDGDPSYSLYKSYSEGMNDCRSAVNEVRKFADVIGIGLYRSEREEEAFKYVFRDACVSMSSLDGLVKELPKRIKKILNT